MLKSVAFRAAPLSSGRIVPRVTIGRVTPFIPSWETYCQTRYYQLFKATTAYTSTCIDARAALTPQLSGSTRVRHWQCQLEVLRFKLPRKNPKKLYMYLVFGQLLNTAMWFLITYPMVTIHVSGAMKGRPTAYAKILLELGWETLQAVVNGGN